MNCLVYALRFWRDNPQYKLWYNSGHVINIPEGLDVMFKCTVSGTIPYSPAEKYGYDYFASAFKEFLNEEDLALLINYFKKKGPIEVVVDAIIAHDGDGLMVHPTMYEKIMHGSNPFVSVTPYGVFWKQLDGGSMRTLTIFVSKVSMEEDRIIVFTIPRIK